MQRISDRISCSEDVYDAEQLSQDPAFRLIGSEKIWEHGAALTSRLQSFETELLTQEENLAGLVAINRELIAKAETTDSPQRVKWTRPRFRFTASRSKAPTTATLNPPAITRCCCSTARATVWQRTYGRATCIVPKTGTKGFCRRTRYYWLLLAESHLTRRLFGSMVERIAALPLLTR
jgi:hypothetical protein